MKSLSKSEEKLMNHFMRLKLRETSSKFWSNIITTISVVALVVISVWASFANSNFLYLLLLLAFPFTIIALSSVKQSKTIASYIIFAISLLANAFMVKESPFVVVCIVGFAISYILHFFVEQPATQELLSIQELPEFKQIEAKLLKSKKK